MRTPSRKSIGAFLERSVGDFQPERRFRFERARSALERFALGPLRVLDAGCGDGGLAVELARRHPDWTVVGVDTNAEMLRRAEERAERHGLRNLSFELNDIGAPAGSAVYDGVVAIQLLEEVLDDEAALRSMTQALRPGGLFLADVPELTWRPVLRGSEPTWRHEVRHGYSAQEIADKLARCGLELERITPSAHGTIRLAQEIRDRMKRRGVRLRVLCYPVLAAAVPLERKGVTWGPPHSLFVEARRGAPVLAPAAAGAQAGRLV